MKKINFLIGWLAIVSVPIHVCAADNFSENITGRNFSSSYPVSKYSNDPSLGGSNNSGTDLETTLSNITDEMQGSFSELSDSMSLDSLSSIKDAGVDAQSADTQAEKSNLQKYQDAFDQSRAVMQEGLPTLETESIDDLRNQLTDSVKLNAASTLKEHMGDSFTGLDTDLFNISGMPSSESFSMESLNVHYAEMLEEFERASTDISESLNHKINENATSIGDLNTELENWRNSDSYKVISNKISLADVFGSLEKQLPDKNS